MVSKLLAGGLYRLGRWFLAWGNPGLNQAHRCLRLSRSLWPGNPAVQPWLAYLEGLQALRRGRAEGALEALQWAARGLPEVAAIRARLGVCLTMLGRDEESISALERVLCEPLDGLEAEVYPALAWSYLRSGRAAQACEVCERAAELSRPSRRLELIGQLARGVVDDELYVPDLCATLIRNPQATPLLLEYAHLQAREGRRQLAEAALGALPDELRPRTFALIGQASLNEEDHQTVLWAAEQLEQFEGLEPRASATMLRAEVALREDDLSGAEALMRRALEQWPEQGLLHEQMGRVLLLSGQWEPAVEEMIEALHSGLSGALAAGMAALAALDLGDTPSARGVFGVTRLGDGLGCAFAQAAQARLSAVDGQLADTLRLANGALGQMAQLPAWALRPVVKQRLALALRTALQTVRDTGDEPQRGAAAELWDRLVACLEDESGIPCAVTQHQ